MIAAAVVCSVIIGKRKRKKIPGRVLANTGFYTGTAVYKKRMALYRALSFMFRLFLVLACISSLWLMSRPYRVKEIPGGVKKRDIFLCLDISYSLYDINYDLVKSYEEVVKGLEGDRFGIAVFNTSTVLYVPMTDDYDYVLEKMHDLEDYLLLQKEYVERYGMVTYEYFYPDDDYEDYIHRLSLVESGTLVRNQTKGSSLIGEGLASCLFRFPRLDESDRTRHIILSTDNDQTPIDAPDVEIEEASEFCGNHHVRMYAVCPERPLAGSDDGGYDDYYYDQYYGYTYRHTLGSQAERYAQLAECAEKTGGKCYPADGDLKMSDIVDEIQKEEAKEVRELVIRKKEDLPERPFIALCLCLVAAFGTGVAKRRWY